jgi:shikimate dehydrogenase
MGCKTVSGLEMLVNQGVIGIKYWTGINVNPIIMHDILRKVLAMDTEN